MKTETFQLELITPCFCGGAEPEKQAEIRAPSIRGQLRWWFRTLRGFKSLTARGLSVRDQEALIFGNTAGDGGKAGELIVRVSPPRGCKLTDSANHPQPNMRKPEGYLLFPLRQQTRMKSSLPCFDLTVVWRGEPDLWEDIRALIAVFGHFGGLGFRSRRAMGALAFRSHVPDVSSARQRFARPDNILVKELKEPSPMHQEQCISELANWLRGWRQHGQMYRRWDKKEQRWISISDEQQQENRRQPGFKYARRDHNEGLDVQGTGSPKPDPETPRGQAGETFRPALGLPIIQYFSSLGRPHGPLGQAAATVNWDWEWDREKKKGEGRFASPVILRPYKDAQGKWHALVIFVEAHKWPEGKEVHLSCGGRHETRRVSLELYNKMKDDPRLRPFP